MASSSTVYSNPPCAACKFLRRKCVSGCVLAPYFGPEEPAKFFHVHKVFGASNVSKLLSQLPPQHRHDAVSSLAYEAEARLRDPVYGCVRAISLLQAQLLTLQKQLDATNADLMRFAATSSSTVDQSVVIRNENGFGSFNPNPVFSSPGNWPGEGHDQDHGAI